MSANKVSRRTFLQTAALAGTTTVAGGILPGVAPAAPLGRSPAGPTVVAHNDTNIVETVYGKVRGSEHSGIHIFRGIPYGANTGGENRFLPGRKADPWTGVRSALWYEHVCPQAFRESWNDDEHAFLFQWNDGISGEDCMRANVWTPGINDNKKRPVMVWVHGGGFTFGSGQELPALDGEMLARRGDVVYVSFNHRLNAFGFLDLSEICGAKYATSGNVGQTDLVLLLEWIRDNIANFGGDPSNVTLLGQSGGGAKVSILLAMPSAEGLFHKACIHSGSALTIADKEASLRTSSAVLKELGVTSANLDKLNTVSTDQLLKAGIDALRKANTGPAPVRGVTSRGGTPRLAFGPYVDGTVIPRHPFDPGAPEISASIPIMVGSVLNEFTTAIDKPDAFSMTNEQLIAQLTPTYGSHTSQIIEVFRKGHPKANAFQIGSIVAATQSSRIRAVTQAQRKAVLGKASAYNFWFQWQTPVLDGRPMAFHCSDLSFFFDNTLRCETMTGDGPEAHKLAAQMSEAWIAFAKKGDPNHPGIPRWNPVTPSGSETMIFDNPTQFKQDPDSAERKALAEALA